VALFDNTNRSISYICFTE